MNKSSETTINFRIAKDELTKQDIYKLRYNIYAEEMGKNLSTVDHKSKLIYDEKDKTAVHFYLEEGGEIVACLRTNFGKDGAFLSEEKKNYAFEKFGNYKEKNFCISSKLMIAPHLRNSGVVGQLLVRAYLYARERGAQFDFCNCATSLVQLYEFFGYRRYKKNITDEDVGLRVPLVCVLEDVQHLEFVNSPFFRVAKTLKNSTETADWYAANFRVKVRHIYKNLLPEKKLWEHFFNSYREHTLELFENLNDKEKQKIHGLGIMIEIGSGMEIIRRTEWGESIYMIIYGKVEIIVSNKYENVTIDILSAGKVFGETALLGLLGQTNATALEDSKLLVLSKSSFEKLSKRNPETALKIVMNLMRSIGSKFDALADKCVYSNEYIKQ